MPYRRCWPTVYNTSRTGSGWWACGTNARFPSSPPVRFFCRSPSTRSFCLFLRASISLYFFFPLRHKNMGRMRNKQESAHVRALKKKDSKVDLRQRSRAPSLFFYFCLFCLPLLFASIQDSVGGPSPPPQKVFSFDLARRGRLCGPTPCAGSGCAPIGDGHVKKKRKRQKNRGPRVAPCPDRLGSWRRSAGSVATQRTILFFFLARLMAHTGDFLK